ncbi:specific transcriptional repressor [Rhizophagus clarus]|uniref:Specific transcriptional repressor n=1 Tax=Rhizophagus clarus TaxID=94130 RepID=A0A8H3L4N6_9GLOM|nr:specific transcriptional repressor [Rhizophagus clarus]
MKTVTNKNKNVPNSSMEDLANSLMDKLDRRVQARERGVCNMRVISKVTGMLWRGASTDEKEQYENLAFQVQSLHSKRYPNYKYKPTSRAKIHPTLYQPYPIPQHQILPFSANQIGPIIPPYALPDMFYNNSDGMIMQDDVNLYNNMYMPCL